MGGIARRHGEILVELRRKQPSGEDEQKMGHYVRKGAENPDFALSGQRFAARVGQWTGVQGRGVLTKPEPPAWSQGSTKPEYFMAPPSTKRLQN